MFQCVNCEQEGAEFNVKIVGNDQGSLVFKAVCPLCKSEMVKVLPGPKVEDMKLVII